jgi:hypothetical protein
MTRSAGEAGKSLTELRRSADAWDRNNAKLLADLGQPQTFLVRRRFRFFLRQKHRFLSLELFPINRKRSSFYLASNFIRSY